ncbi:MAG: hypothetical protein M1826_002595 [Phylliscum demangeonii]|nr:MAG: hypothetical protein M1826_002595 [Phylliscum demangeonii]
MASLVKFLLLLGPALMLPSSCGAHMEMLSPYPIRSRFDPQTPDGLRDYNMVAPLRGDGSDFPCKGYHDDEPRRSVATYQAGSSHQVVIVGGAEHGGGSCQLALSYDNGQSFAVIKSMIGACPLTSPYAFTIPDDAPPGQALLAWTWFNLVGNREMYMNCARVDVESSGGSANAVPSASSSSTTFADLPALYLANIGSKSACATVENQAVVFPRPGPDAVYGGGVTAASAPSPGLCEGVDSVPGDGPSSPSTGNETVASLDDAPSSTDPATTIPTIRHLLSMPDDTMPSSITTASAGGGGGSISDGATFRVANPFPSSYFYHHPSTITDYGNSRYAAYLATLAHPTRSSSSVRGGGSAASAVPTLVLTTTFSQASGTDSTAPYSSSADADSATTSPTTSPTDASFATIMLSDSNSPTTPSLFLAPPPVPAPITTITTTTTTIPIPSPIPAAAAAAACDPGSIRCDSASQFSMCNGLGTAFIAMGRVAPGTVCLDRRISRGPHPFGACGGRDAADNAALLRCAPDGASFRICQDGWWVDMGPVASGTACWNGAIVDARHSFVKARPRARPRPRPRPRP